MSKSVIKSVAFQGDVHEGLKILATKRNVVADRQGCPRTNFNFMVNMACKQYLGRENGARGKGGER